VSVWYSGTSHPGHRQEKGRKDVTSKKVPERYSTNLFLKGRIEDVGAFMRIAPNGAPSMAFLPFFQPESNTIMFLVYRHIL
jgi:hypothetical protein